MANDKIFNADRYFANTPAALPNQTKNYELIPDIDDYDEDDDQTQASDTSSYHFGSVAPASQTGSVSLFDAASIPGITQTQPAPQNQKFESRFEDLKRDKQSWTNFNETDWHKCKYFQNYSLDSNTREYLVSNC